MQHIMSTAAFAPACAAAANKRAASFSLHWAERPSCITGLTYESLKCVGPNGRAQAKSLHARQQPDVMGEGVVELVLQLGDSGLGPLGVEVLFQDFVEGVEFATVCRLLEADFSAE